MGKKRAHENGDEVEILDDSTVAEPSTKRSKHEEGSTANDKIEIWLIKKPKNVSIDALQNIRIPKKFKDNNRERTFETSDGPLNCTFEKPGKSMLYFQTPTVAQDIKEVSKLPILQSVRGVALLKNHAEIEDPFPEAVEDDLRLA